VKTAKEHSDAIYAARRTEREERRAKNKMVLLGLEKVPVPEGQRGTHALQNRLAVERASAQDTGLIWLNIACDECGHEMFGHSGRILACSPPKRNADCPQCGYHTYIPA